MGKGLKNTNLVMRTGKLAFYLVPGNSAYTRMEGFTSLSNSKNASTYERQYVDEDFKRTSTTGYNSSTSYALDRYKEHPVTSDIIQIHENELIGQDAVRSIIQVDMTTAVNTGGSAWKATGKMRDYSVVPSADGDTTDCLTYSGDFKSCGEMEEVEVTTPDNWQTIQIAGQEVAPYLKSLSVTSGSSTVALTPEFVSTTTVYKLTASGYVHNITATAENSSNQISILYNNAQRAYGSGSATAAGITFNADTTVTIIVGNGVMSRSYIIQVTSASTASED